MVLLLLAIVLFVPFTYVAKGRYNDEQSVKAGVSLSWLFKALSLKIIYNKDIKFRLTLFGKTLLKKKLKDHDNLVFNIIDEDTDDETEQSDNKLDSFHENIGSSNQNILAESVDFDVGNNDKYPKIEKNIGKTEKKSFEDKIIDKIFQLKKKLAPKYRRLKNKIDNFLYKVDNKLEYIEEQKDIFLTEENVRLGKKLFIKVGKLLRHILPSKTKIEGEVGFEDPCTTGQMVAFTSMLNPKLVDVDIIPNFEDEVKDIHLKADGRIFIGYILWQGLLVVCDKNFWKLLGKIKNRR